MNRGTTPLTKEADIPRRENLSVVMPGCNEETTIIALLEKIHAQTLTNTKNNFLIVADDCFSFNRENRFLEHESTPPAMH